MRYRAFLSYSHTDARWARWLVHRLETYRVPARLVGTPGRDGPIPTRLGAIFRDRDELPSAGDLSSNIRQALSESDTLVVVCSPAAAQSKWVDAEAAAFRDNGRGAQVLCFIVAGDPARGDCFPPAVLTDAQGRPREPLAADARREGDGRERAFLKLVAGLLGVGFDALARREAQRRHRKLAWLTAAAIAGMAVTSSLAVSAYLARNDAQRRQAQAEDILGFMLGDLRGKLTTVGRLDLMRSVDDKATRYFATVDPRDLSDRALEDQARSLTGIGQVRLEEGKHDAAMTAFREAHARSTALHERAPDNGRRLFDLAQAQYWIGFVYWQQGKLDAAQTWLTKYRDSAVTLAAMDRGNFAWQKEVAYGHHNLAVLADSRGRHADAERAIRQELTLFQSWAKQRPADATLRYETSTVVSWLGANALQQGRLREAEAHFAAQLHILEQLRRLKPDNARWKEESVDARVLLAEAQAKQGRREAARRHIDDAGTLATQMLRDDPANNTWRSQLGICRWWQAALDADATPTRGRNRATQAQSLLETVHAGKPDDTRVLGWLVRTLVLLARLDLAEGSAAAAGRRLSDARALLRTQPAGDGETADDGVFRVLLAEDLILAGETAQLASAPDAAQTAWLQARTALLTDAPAVVPFDRLDPLVRALDHLGHDDQAMPYRQRLLAAGYAPLWPWPAHTGVAAR